MSRGNTKIELVPLDDRHIARFLELSGDPELLRTMGWRPFDTEEKERFLDVVRVLTLPGLDGGSAEIFSIVTAENEAVGYVVIKGINDGADCAEIGIAVMDKAYRGRGIGGKAMWLAADYAFGELGLSILGLTVFPDNERAIKTYERLGYKKQELLKNSWRMPDGTLTDMWLMELVSDEAGSGVDPARCKQCSKQDNCSRRK